MTGRLILSVHLIFFLALPLYSQDRNITIYGKNIEYAGRELNFYIYRERIFDSFESLSKTTADSTGAFSVQFSLETTKCVYCQTPLYTAFIFAEPGRSYPVILPPASPGKLENRHNPFFIKPLWHLKTSDVSTNNHEVELNAAIDSFNKQFDPFLDKQVLLYYDSQQNREKLDSFTLAVKSLPEPVKKEYFQSYRMYKLATLGFMENQYNYHELYEKYLKNKPVLPDVPSWWEFFNLYYDGYLSSLNTKKEYSELYSYMGKGQYYALNQLLKKDSALQNDQIREWAILKEIHKVFYQNGIPLNTLLALCDSLEVNSSDKLSISIAEIIKKEASALNVGRTPPAGVLLNSEGDHLELSSLKGKYSYIGFCSLDNTGCQKEFEYLKYFYHKHGNLLDLVIILPESEKDRIDSFSYENSIPWKFWYSPDGSTIQKDYKVKAFPLFYLLDREGKLLMSPAILPSGGFEQQLFNILRSRKEI